MKCLAIKKNLVCCKANAVAYEDYCAFHRDSDYEEHHRKRWWKKYILGQKRGPYLNSYGQQGRERITSDIESGRIVITDDDMGSIPKEDQYIDIYALLCKLGVARANSNTSLWVKGLLYVITCHLVGHRNLSGKILTYVNELQEILLFDTTELFGLFLEMIAAKVARTPGFNVSNLVNITSWMSQLLELDLTKRLSWENKADFIYNSFCAELTPEHHLTHWMAGRFVPELKNILKTEMEVQKAKMLHYKEEIVAKAWHPRRLELYLNMGYSLEDVLDEEVDTTLHTKCILQEKSTLYKHISLGDA